MGRIGGGELLLIALIALLLFGAGRLSDIGKGLGEGIRAFKKGLSEEEEAKAEEAKKAEEQKSLESPPAAPKADEQKPA